MTNPYNKKYATPELYWGTNPSSLCDALIHVVKPEHCHTKTLLDIGCGEGRNALYLASHGFNVTALDEAENGLAKLIQQAHEKKVEIKTILANLNTYPFPEQFDIFFSTGTFQYIPPESRPQLVSHLQSKTPKGGYHAISVLVTKPFIDKAPDSDDTVVLFYSGELLSYYRDWKIHFSIEDIFDCTSGGVPHRHGVNRIIAERMI